MIQIVFEDDYLIVVNKRANLLTVPTATRKYPTLTNQASEYLKTKNQKAFACHRLDRQTSGLVIYAKRKDIQKDIMLQFKKRKIHKRYFAIVQGSIVEKSRVIRNTVCPRGKPARFAVTKFTVMHRSKDFSFLDIEPETGRTNQIRIHLCQIGHPVIGERKYTVAKRWPVKFRRACLHAYSIEFQHPVSKDKVNIKIGLAPDIQNFLDNHHLEVRL